MKLLFNCKSLIFLVTLFTLVCHTALNAADQKISFKLENTNDEKYSNSTINIIKQSLRTVDDDFIDIINIPKDYPKITQNSLLLVGGLILTDRYLTGLYQDNVEEIFSDFKLPALPYEGSLRSLGLAREDYYLLTGLALNFGYGAITEQQRPQQASILSLKAMAYSSIVSQLVLKSIIARKRPYPNLNSDDNVDKGTYTDDPFKFFYHKGVPYPPRAYATAMPSYHFTQFFSVAHVLSGTYDNAWWPYGGAAILSLSNIRGHNHWVSDMVAGTLLGIGIGEVILRNSDGYTFGEYKLKPEAVLKGVEIKLTKEF